MKPKRGTGRLVLGEQRDPTVKENTDEQNAFQPHRKLASNLRPSGPSAGATPSGQPNGIGTARRPARADGAATVWKARFDRRATTKESSNAPQIVFSCCSPAERERNGETGLFSGRSGVNDNDGVISFFRGRYQRWNGGGARGPAVWRDPDIGRSSRTTKASLTKHR